MLLFILTCFALLFHSLNPFFHRFRRQSNGCGPSNFNIDEFLREIGEEILIVCCNDHDLCYDTCGQKRFTCDTTFLHCMIQRCQQLLDVNRCKTDARILFWFVFFGGQSAYEQAQQQHQCSLSKQIINNTFIQTIK